MSVAAAKKKGGRPKLPRERKMLKRTVYLYPHEAEWLCKHYGSTTRGLQILIREAMIADHTTGQSGAVVKATEPDLSDLDRPQPRRVKVPEDPADPLAGFCERCRRIGQASCSACKALVAKRQRG